MFNIYFPVAAMATSCGYEASTIEPLPFENLLNEPAEEKSDVGILFIYRLSVSLHLQGI